MKTKIIIGLMLFLAWGTAQLPAATLRLPQLTDTIGKQLIMPVYVDTDITTDNVTAYQLRLYVNYPARAALANISTVGTLSNNLNVQYSVNGNIISIAAAGTTPLSGSGVLINLVFDLIGSGAADISFNNGNTGNFFNEGGHTHNFVTGKITVIARPTINVSAQQTLLTIGETTTASASGGTAPYTWSSNNSAVATNSSGNIFTAHSRGVFKAVATDQLGNTGNSADIRVCSFAANIRDTTFYQNNFVEIPVNIQNFDATGIFSGQLTITFNGGVLLFQNLNTTACLLENRYVEYDPKPGSVTVTFAGGSGFTNSGTLFKLRFKVADVSWGNTDINFSSVLFNEDLTVKTKSGRFTVKPLPNLTITPTVTELYTGATQQFNVSGGTAPYTWTVENPQFATIAENGLLTSLLGGVAKVWVTDSYGAKKSCTINIYDTKIKPRDSVATVTNYKIKLPIDINAIAAERNFVAFSGNISYSSSKIDSITIEKTGTLTNQWMLASRLETNKCIFAFSGNSPIVDKGILFYAVIHFNYQVASNDRFDIYCNNMLLNEGSPIAKTEVGIVRITDIYTSEKTVLANDMKVYPTFANEYVSVEIPNESDTQFIISIFDISGKELYNSQQLGTNKIQIPINHLSTGIYLLKVKNAKHSWSSKFIKK